MSLNTLDIDWSKIECIRPTDNEIVKFSSGKGPEYCWCYQHFNWAARETNQAKVFFITSSPPTSEDFGMLVSACQKIVEQENLVYVEEQKKKKGWWEL